MRPTLMSSLILIYSKWDWRVCVEISIHNYLHEVSQSTSLLIVTVCDKSRCVRKTIKLLDNFYDIDTDEIPGFFHYTKKWYLHRAKWRSIFISHMRTLVSPCLHTWLANHKRAFRSGERPFLFNFLSQNVFFFKIRFCCYRIFLFFIRILTFWNRKYKYYCLILFYNFMSKFHNIFVISILNMQ